MCKRVVINISKKYLKNKNRFLEFLDYYLSIHPHLLLHPTIKIIE
jgi:hypothetical protein